MTADARRPARPVHTYSIVARDPRTGALGVAVQSHWFNVGRIVPWVRPGVGAVATQSLADPTYGPRILDRIARGDDAAHALAACLAEDDAASVRQVAVVDARGRVAAHTGEGCIAYAGHETGDGWSVQANIMRTADVVPAIARAFAEAEGDLAERLLSGLEAGEDAGGDLRGAQSAALVVAVPGMAVMAVDLRVEDHPDPVGEMRRLLTAHRAYEHMNAGDGALEAGDVARAAAEYEAAALLHDDPEVRFWGALTLAQVGRLDEAVHGLRDATSANPDLVELLRRVADAGLVEATLAARLLDALHPRR